MQATLDRPRAKAVGAPELDIRFRDSMIADLCRLGWSQRDVASLAGLSQVGVLKAVRRAQGRWKQADPGPNA